MSKASKQSAVHQRKPVIAEVMPVVPPVIVEPAPVIPEIVEPAPVIPEMKPVEPTLEELKADAAMLMEATKEPEAPQPLRTDGPTLEEYVAAGYKAENYPPVGYAPRTAAPAPLKRNPYGFVQYPSSIGGDR